MQNQKSQSLNTQDLAQGPVEIDAEMLKHIGGGSPKGTWGPSGDEAGAAAATTSSVVAEEPSPKGTW